jgi:hypothetical protein
MTRDKILSNTASEKVWEEAMRGHSAERYKAYDRILGLCRGRTFTTEHVVRWCVGFANRGLRALSEGQLHDLRYEVNHIVHGHGGAIFPTGGQSAPSFHSGGTWKHTALNDVRRPSDREKVILAQLPSRATICGLQRRTRKHLDELLETGRAELVLPRGAKIFLFHFKDGKKVNSDLTLYCDAETVYEHKLLSALSHHPGSLRRCPGCNIRFVADRTNHDFHTPACRSRHYMRIKRGSLPERFGQRGRPRKSLSVTQMRKENKRSTGKKEGGVIARKDGKD